MGKYLAKPGDGARRRGRWRRGDNSSPFMGKYPAKPGDGAGLTAWLEPREGRRHPRQVPAGRTIAARRMRTSMNATELLIWSRLRGRKGDGWKFRPQQPIGPYFVAFYCNAARRAVEIDGPVHWDEAQSAYDVRRQAWLEAEGNRMLRIQVSEITRSLADVMDTIDGVLLEQEELGFARRPRPSGAFGATSP